MFFVRFCANMITLSVAGFYKAFGQSFISDDHFLDLVKMECRPVIIRAFANSLREGEFDQSLKTAW